MFYLFLDIFIHFYISVFIKAAYQ